MPWTYIMPEVESGIPIPPKKKPKKKSPFKSPWKTLLEGMAVGDSIRLPTFRAACIKQNAKRLGYEVHVEDEGKMIDPNDWRHKHSTMQAQPMNACRIWIRSKPSVSPPSDNHQDYDFLYPHTR